MTAHSLPLKSNSRRAFAVFIGTGLALAMAFASVPAAQAEPIPHSFFGAMSHYLYCASHNLSDPAKYKEECGYPGPGPAIGPNDGDTAGPGSAGCYFYQTENVRFQEKCYIGD
ncbi:MAG TPA: hypothetical protein VIL84_15215 [Devosiaceae bacterium]